MLIEYTYTVWFHPFDFVIAVSLQDRQHSNNIFFLENFILEITYSFLRLFVLFVMVCLCFINMLELSFCSQDTKLITYLSILSHLSMISVSWAKLYWIIFWVRILFKSQKKELEIFLQFSKTGGATFETMKWVVEV